MKLAHLLRNPLFLLEGASENPTGGGGAAPGAVVTTPPVDPGQTAPPGVVPGTGAPAVDPGQGAPPVPAAVTPNLGDRLMAIALPKADLVAQNRDLNGRVGTLTSQLSAVTSELEQARSAMAALKQENDGFRAAVAQLEAGQKTLEQGVTQELASLKVPRADLVTPTPAGAQGVPTSQADLEAQLATLKTHREKQALIARYDAAQKAG